MTNSPTDHERALRTRRDVLRQEISESAARAAQARSAGAGTSSDVHDAKDDADAAQAHTRADAETQRDRVELQQVEEALARLAAGSYGVCTACGQPIPKGRLKAEPACARCQPCQTHLETARRSL